MVAPGDGLVADRGFCSYVHLTFLVQAGVHAVLRIGARQIVDFTPGRTFVKPGVRRTPAVTGVPRSRWLKGLGVHDQWVAMDLEHPPAEGLAVRGAIAG